MPKSTLLGGSAGGRPLRRRLQPQLKFEQLEVRTVMDGAGWEHTDPPEDPDSIVGVARVRAENDYVEAAATTEQLQIHALANDTLPSGSTSLRIVSVSATARGARVTVSEDGQRIIYSAPEGGVGWDNFYYIIEDDAGNRGQANVSISVQPTYSPFNPRAGDSYNVFEDGAERELFVLQNDGPFASGEIVAVTAPTGGGSVRIADDGRSVFYKPATGYSGSESFQYTVRNGAGPEQSSDVWISIAKPVRVGYQSTRLLAGAGPQVVAMIGEGDILAPTPQTPRIVSVTQSPVGTLRISDDGRQVIFEPAEGYLGSFDFSYRVKYGEADYQQVIGTAYASVEVSFLVVDDWQRVDPGVAGQVVDVLANDRIVHRYNAPSVTLSIVEASQGSHGGQIAIGADGKIRYTPAAGFTGEETFTYLVEGSDGARDSATATVYVGAQDTAALPRFTLPGELQQFLLEKAIDRSLWQFGQYQYWYNWSGNGRFLLFDSDTGVRSMTAGASYSTTNTQEAGVDEADIVETDGRYLYTLSHGKLAIVDLEDPANPQLVSLTALNGAFDEMYLMGDKLTLISRGAQWWSGGKAVVAVLDVSDRSDPTIIERTEIDGHIVDSRAVGDRVFIAASGLALPELEMKTVAPASGDVPELRRHETLDEFVARVKATIIADALPTYRTYGADGTLVREGLLTAAEDVIKPVDEADTEVLSLVTFDVDGGAPGPAGSAAIFTSPGHTVYMSGESMYVLRNGNQQTGIFKFDVGEDGAPTLVATGKVDGLLLNQFSVDEHEGRLRIATTETEFQFVNGWQQIAIRVNHLFVLQQEGAELNVVGSVKNLAPTESIKSVRFLDDRAYVVTFRVVDPLFAIDLSNPTQPTVEGAIKIPGFSDYLHPVGEDYVIGIGRDADEITGALGAPQVSLFYVGDLSNPTLVDQVTMTGVTWASTEAWYDHHAVSYFADQGILALPFTWHEPVEEEEEPLTSVTELRLWDWRSYVLNSAIWTFEISVDGTGGGSIEVGGKVTHEGTARRSVRIGEALVTLSDDGIIVSELADPAHELSRLHFGPLPQDDVFTVDEDSGATTLDVLANDRAGSSGGKAPIVSVTQPVQHGWFVAYGGLGDHTFNQESAGTVTIGEDGKLVFTPAANFFGVATFTYTVTDPVHGEETATVQVTVTGVPDDPLAEDDAFEAPADSAATNLDVLANDVNYDAGRGIWYGPLFPVDVDTIVRPMTTNLAMRASSLSINANDVGGLIDVDRSFFPWNPTGLSITAVGETSGGGTVTIDAAGSGLNYQPAPGFVGVDTFTYTITTFYGRTATATVRVQVGEPAEELVEAINPARPAYAPDGRAALGAPTPGERAPYTPASRTMGSTEATLLATVRSTFEPERRGVFAVSPQVERTAYAPDTRSVTSLAAGQPQSPGAPARKSFRPVAVPSLADAASATGGSIAGEASSRPASRSVTLVVQEQSDAAWDEAIGDFDTPLAPQWRASIRPAPGG